MDKRYRQYLHDLMFKNALVMSSMGHRAGNPLYGSITRPEKARGRLLYETATTYSMASVCQDCVMSIGVDVTFRTGKGRVDIMKYEEAARHECPGSVESSIILLGHLDG